MGAPREPLDLEPQVLAIYGDKAYWAIRRRTNPAAGPPLVGPAPETCASCNLTVKIAAEKVAGVREARASKQEARAWVTYDPSRTNPSAIAAAITSAGYEAKPITTTN